MVPEVQPHPDVCKKEVHSGMDGVAESSPANSSSGYPGQTNDDTKMKTGFVILVLLAAIFVRPMQVQCEEPGALPKSPQTMADELVESLDPTMMASIRDSAGTTLNGKLGKPGFMQVVNQIQVEAVPQWALHTKERVANCVIAMAEAKIKGNEFDLLGYLESVSAESDLMANYPVAYKPSELQAGFKITHVMFRVQANAQLSALYVATNFERREILVNEMNGSWRKPTEIERKRILYGKRAVQIGIPMNEDNP